MFVQRDKEEMEGRKAPLLAYVKQSRLHKEVANHARHHDMKHFSTLR